MDINELFERETEADGGVNTGEMNPVVQANVDEPEPDGVRSDGGRHHLDEENNVMGADGGVNNMEEDSAVMGADGGGQNLEEENEVMGDGCG